VSAGTDRASVRFVVPRATRERLATTCFRHPSRGDAGRFASWRSADDVLSDLRIRKQLLIEVERHVRENKAPGSTYSRTVTLPEFVGWESTLSFGEAKGVSVGDAAINRRATALFVDDDTPAPRTRDVTVIFSVDDGQHEDFVAFVVSIYPGLDVGELAGDVSRREGCVFFHWQARGDNGSRWKGR
jgi:hypothetical protein